MVLMHELRQRRNSHARHRPHLDSGTRGPSEVPRYALCLYMHILVHTLISHICQNWYILVYTGTSFYILFFLFAEHICLVHGNVSISVPIIPEAQPLVHFNVLFTHLFKMLSKSQAMSYEINPAKPLPSLHSWRVLFKATDVAIKATDDKPGG